MHEKPNVLTRQDTELNLCSKHHVVRGTGNPAYKLDVENGYVFNHLFFMLQMVIVCHGIFRVALTHIKLGSQMHETCWGKASS